MKIECTVNELKELLNIGFENETEITTINGEKIIKKTPVDATTDVKFLLNGKPIFEENVDNKLVKSTSSKKYN